MFLKSVEREKKAMFERGREEGIELGREQGMEQGVELGVLAVARNMLNAGIAPATIAELTGLPLDTVLTSQQSGHGDNGGKQSPNAQRSQ